MLVAIIVVVVLFVFVTGFGFLSMHKVTHPYRTTYEKAYSMEEKDGSLEGFQDLNPEDMNLTMDDGYLIHGKFLRNEGSNKYVIVTHGYTYNYFGSVKYAMIFYKLGYSVYLYDLRHFGANEITYCSMGYKEHKDIICIANHLRRMFGDDISIGLHGESLGASSSIMAIGEDDRFSFCIADCPFSDCAKLFAEKTREWFHLPSFFFNFGSIALLIVHRHSFNWIRPIDAFLTNKTTPVCFFHGEQDDFIRPINSTRMYELAEAYKELHIVEGAKHAQSIQMDKANYADTIAQFLSKI